MTVENLYRAIGDVDEKHLKQLIDSETGVNKALRSRKSSLSERTIVMDVVKQKKNRVRIIAVILAAAIAAGAAAAAFLGTKKDKNEYKEKKIENYFREDENFKFSEVNVLCPEMLYSDENGIYFSGQMSFGSGVSHPNVSLYSISDNELTVIEPEGCETDVFTAVSVSDKNVWLKYSTSDSESELIRIDTDTSQISGRLRFDEDDWIMDVTENDDGTYLIRRSIYNNDYELSDLVYSVYDDNLNLISEKSVIDHEIMSVPDTEIAGNEKADDGSYYTVYIDADREFILCKYSPENEMVYSIKNITADLEGDYMGMFISAKGNPAVYSYDTKSDLYYFDEYDAENGDVINRYETKLDSNAAGVFTASPYFAKGGSFREYDFSYISDKKIYGCKASDDGNELIADLSEMFSDSVSILSLAVSDNLILLSGEYQESSETGMFICKSDYSGNILAKNKFSNIIGKDNTSLKQIISDKNGEIWVLMENFYEGKCVAVNLDKNMNPKKKTELDISSEHFIADTSGRIALTDFATEIVLYDDKGNRLCSEKITHDAYYFESDGKYYAAVTDKKESGTVIYLLDFDKSRISEINTLDFTIDDTLNGFGKYDVCFKFNDGIYGYSLKDNSVEEVINWIDSDLDFNPSNISVIDENTMICVYWKYGEITKPYFSLLKRVDDETLKLIQERKVLNVAAGIISDNVRDIIKEYNRTNEYYKVHIDDFSKYSDNAGFFSYFRDSGLSALESEFVNGYVPDMILFDSDFDILKYKGYNAFADIEELLPDVVSGEEEYFKNILDLYKTEDKHYALPLTYKLNCLTGKNENVNGKTLLSVTELSEMNNEIPVFFGESFETLTNQLINSNINEFIDADKYTCDFENESFVKLLELIKNNGISDEEFRDTGLTSSSYNSRLAEGLCRLVPYTVTSFSSVTVNEQYNHLEEDSVYAGLPSEKSSGILVYPVTTAAVFDSSPNKEAASDLLKHLISEEIQYQSCLLYNSQDSFPVNKSAYMRLFEKEKNAENSPFTDCYGKRINLKSPDEITLKKVNNLISSASVTSLSDSKIREIINEQTSLYYSDVQSAENTAKNIQKKVSLYLKEIK